MEFYAVSAIFQPYNGGNLSLFKVRIKNPYVTKFTIFFQSKSVRSGRTYSGRNSPEEPPSPDLSRLTPEEICILKKVIQRQEEFENEEASCIWWVTTKYIALALRCPCTSLYWCLMNNALPGDSLTNQMGPDQQLSRNNLWIPMLFLRMLSVSTTYQKKTFHDQRVCLQYGCW